MGLEERKRVEKGFLVERIMSWLFTEGSRVLWPLYIERYGPVVRTFSASSLLHLLRHIYIVVQRKPVPTHGSGDVIQDSLVFVPAVSLLAAD